MGLLSFLSPKVERLLRAAEEGEAAKVRSLLRSGVETDGRSEDGSTALMLAAFNGHVEVVKKLLEAKADAEAENQAGETPLELALLGEQPEVVRLLLRAGASPTRGLHGKGHTPAMIAAGRADPTLLETVLEAGGDPKAASADGRTPLHEACYFGRLQNVFRLLSAKVPVEVRDARGITPLMLLVSELRSWATLDQARRLSGKGRNAISVVADLVRIAEGGGTAPLPAGTLDTLRKLLQAGSNVNARDDKGNSVLGAAIRAAAPPEVVQSLLEAGAAPNAPEPDGKSPLELAADHPNPNVLVLLRSVAGRR